MRLIDESTYEGWRNAAKSELYSQHIHPSGVDKELYYQTGKVYADKILQHVKPGDLVMDYGCGNGRILQHIRDPKVGIDIVPEAAAMIGGFTPDQYNGKVNVIYSVCVFIHNPYEICCNILQWMHERLKAKGKLLLQMPLYSEGKNPLHPMDVGVWTQAMFEKAVKDYKIIDMHVNPGSFTFESIGPYHHDFHVLVKK